MWLIAGIAAAAVGVMSWWNKSVAPSTVVSTVITMRKQTGVIAAIVNMINALLKTFVMVRQPSFSGEEYGGEE